MKISEQGLALLKQSEGFSATPYICPAGKSTIGYGHVIISGEEFTDSISKEQAETIIIQDVNTSEQAVSRLVKIPLNQNQFDALVVFVYNIGIEAFEKSTLLKDLNAGNIPAALLEWGRWVYGGGKILEGLVARREAEKALFLQNISGAS